MSKKDGNGDGEGEGDYEIGYKKPPKHSQFTKGQSGNKRGRPKKRITFSDVEDAFDSALGAYITVSENGIVRQIKKLNVLATQTVNKALQGNHQATNVVLSLLAKQAAGASDEASSGTTADEFKAEMEAIFEEMASKIATGAKASPEADGNEDGDGGGGAASSDGMPPGKPQ